MASYVYSLGMKLFSQLPQNEHTKNVAEIESQVSDLRQALADKACDTFKTIVSKTSEQLRLEKQKCADRLDRLNGAFFQDPKSLLKQAWDAVVENIQQALAIKIETRDQLEPLSLQLKSLPDQKEEKVIKAKAAIETYIHREKKRDTAEQQFKNILCTEKTGASASSIQSSLSSQLDDLRIRQRELCGDYYQDPKGLLDIAWKQYHQASLAGTPDAPALLGVFTRLDEERKSNDGKLYALEQQISVTGSPERSIEVLTAASITEQVHSLEKTKDGESALAGVDWKKTAATAATLAILSAGYIATYVPLS